MTGKIYLIPNTISDDSIDLAIPLEVKNIISKLSHFIVEDIRTARRFLKKVNKDFDIDLISFYTLNKHTKSNDVFEYLQVTFQGTDIGIISEAGAPCIADPGNVIVALAHKYNLSVVPLTGPSSILLALMASGLNGQNFAFNGYLPVQKNERTLKIRNLEQRSLREKQTQIFMETPYRNDQLLSDILSTCKNNTFLCIASNINDKNEFIKTLSISEWKTTKNISINKKPSIFLIQAI